MYIALRLLNGLTLWRGNAFSGAILFLSLSHGGEIIYLKQLKIRTSLINNDI